jgi:pyruvate/2-oxoglutarate dehydrogenase complex dihydrolipoamide dehydrogenase (E3) component
MSLTRPEIIIHPNNLAASALKTRIYDVVIIGGGPAGESTAARVVRGGLTALLIESELVGGECPYWACVPSKALLRASETIEGAKAVGGARQRLQLLSQKYGVPAKPEVDLEGLWARRDMFAHGWKDDFQVDAMHGIGVDVAHGFGRLSGVRKVEVKDWHSEEVVEVEAKQAVVIATGSASIIPNIPGLTESRYWTPREAVSGA